MTQHYTTKFGEDMFHLECSGSKEVGRSREIGSSVLYAEEGADLLDGELIA